MEARPIEIAGPGGAIAIRPENVYFAFGDGTLHYDCVSCRAQCCRGHGYNVLLGRELQAHVAAAPAVRFFIEPCDRGFGPSHLHVKNTVPRCFFLRADDQCEIQVSRGYEVKPETCRLFPFNDFRLAGDHLVVLPHLTLCPLGVATPATSASSMHASLLEEFVARGVGSHLQRTSARYDERLYAMERALVKRSDRCVADGDIWQFIADQRTLSAGYMAPSDGRTDVSSDALPRFWRRLEQVLDAKGLLERSEDGSVERCVVAAAPAIRAHLLFPAPGPSTIDLTQMPEVIAAWYALVLLARRAGMTGMTVQTATRLFVENRLLIMLLARIDQVVVWRRGAAVDLGPPMDDAARRRYVQLLQLLVRRRLSLNPRTLGELLCECATRDGVDRMLFIRTVAHRLLGRLEPMADTPARSMTRGGALQQWAVDRLDVATVLSLTDTVARATARKMPIMRRG